MKKKINIRSQHLAITSFILFLIIPCDFFVASFIFFSILTLFKINE